MNTTTNNQAKKFRPRFAIEALLVCLALAACDTPREHAFVPKQLDAAPSVETDDAGICLVPDQEDAAVGAAGFGGAGGTGNDHSGHGGR